MPTFTLSALQGLVYDGLDGNNLLYPTAQVTSVLNEVLRKVNLLTGFSQDTIAVPGSTVANQLLYSTPPGILVPLKVYYEEQELEKYSLRQLSERYRNWAVDLNTWEGQVARWFTLGLTTFGIHPLDTIGGGLLEVQGITPFTPLSLPGDFVNLNDELCEILVKYCRGRLMIKETGGPFEQAGLVYQEFIRSMKAMTIWTEMQWPAYFLEKQLEPADGKGA